MSEVPLPHAHGAPVLRATLRGRPEDFFVEEIDGFEASGSGEHLLLTVEKRGMNTAFAAQRIARWAGVPEMAVSFAGLKDRHAVTRQRFSVHLPGREAPELATLESDDLRVLASHRHARKLPRGALAGNRFVLLLRDVAGDRESIEDRLRAIAAAGVPNYFGEQRFGREGDNVELARRMFAGQRVNNREKRAIYLSAARSLLFNRLLARRVARGDWNCAADGEVFMLDGSHSVFGPEPMTVELQSRLERFDIHPTGPLWGRGELRSGAALAALEREVCEAEPELCRGLEAADMRQERRALRLPVHELDWRWVGAEVLELRLRLPPGSYATTVLSELGECQGNVPFRQ